MPAEIKALEAAAKAYAEATNYYVPFHPGLSSASADNIRNGIRAAISSYEAARETGWRSVPVEPTEAMVAAFDNLDGWDADPDYPTAREAWSAMLSASPLQEPILTKQDDKP